MNRPARIAKKSRKALSYATVAATAAYKAYQKYKSGSKPKATTTVSAPTSGDPSRVRRTQKPKRVLKKGPAQKLSKRVRNLERSLHDDEGILIHRYLSTGKIAASANAQAMGYFSSNYVTSIEDCLTRLRFFDPSTPGTYTTVNLTTGTNSKAVRMNCYSSLTLRNNYVIPCKASLYLLAPKADTSLDPVTCINDGLSDQSAGPLTAASLTVHPTDSGIFQDLWKIEKKESCILNPSSELKLNFKTKQFVYDPSIVDDHNSSYQRRHQARVWLVAIQGIISHDTTEPAEQGLAPCGVDVLHSRRYEVHYPAGIKVKFFTEDVTGLDTFSNSAQVTNNPPTQQQGYAI